MQTVPPRAILDAVHRASSSRLRLRRARRLRVWAALVALALLPAACSTNPVTGKSEIVLMSDEDERRVDEEAARQVEAQMGLVEDPELTAYVDALGQRLARFSPRQDVRYRFHVVAMDEPNAFALPGGHIYVSRGLLALLNSEAELANVLGHEIGHVAARHAAQRDTMLKVMTVLNTVGMIGAAAGGATVNGNGGPVGNPGLQAYSRRQESQADEIGQNLAVEAGIDPAGMASLLRSLDAYERLKRGYSRETSYFDSHPAARERAAEAATAAEVRRFDGRFRIAKDRADFLERMQGLSVGPPAAEGVVENGRFVHPELGFTLRFPQGWEVENTHSAVYAISPAREAVVVLELQGEGDDPSAAAYAWLDGAAGGRNATATKIGDLEAYRLRGDVPTPAGRTRADVTWIAYDGFVYRLTGFVLDGSFDRWDGVFRSFPRSFRPLDDTERETVTEVRLRIVEAREGESLADLGRRSGNEWDVVETAIYNSLSPARPLDAGQPVKIAVRVPYRPRRERPPSEPERVPRAEETGPRADRVPLGLAPEATADGGAGGRAVRSR